MSKVQFGRRTYVAPQAPHSAPRLPLYMWFIMGAMGSLALLGAVAGPQTHDNVEGFAQFFETTYANR